jgi:hypothetical protein
MNVSGRKAVGYVGVGLIGLVIGYFAGREHLKYENAERTRIHRRGNPKEICFRLPKQPPRVRS